MPKIPEFDAGSGKLTPSEGGAEGLARSGMMIARMAHAGAEATRQTGQEMKQGIDAIGSAFGSMEAKAQAHTDAMAASDADAQMNAETIAANGAVTDGSTPTTADGEPITDAVGHGGEQGLPQDANVPSPGSFSVVASNAIDRHKAAGVSFLDKISGQGVSQKAQDAIAEKWQRHTEQVQLKAQAEASAVATTAVVHANDATTNGLLSNINQHPETLNDNLLHGKESFDTLRSHGTGTAAKQLDQLAIKAEEAFRDKAVKAAYEGVARKGGDAAIAEATKVMDAHPGDVKDRQAGLNEINRLANAQNLNLERQQRQEERDQAIKIDKTSGDAWEKSQLPSTDPNYLKDPKGELRKQFHGNDLIAAEREVDLLQKDKDNPVDKDTSSKTAVDIQGRIDAGMNRKDAEAELQTAWDKREISKSDLLQSKRYAAQSETAEGKWITNHLNDFLKNNTGRIVPGYDPSLPGAKLDLGKQQVQAYRDWVNEKYTAATPAQRLDLFDKTKPGNVVSDEALSQFRVTDDLVSAHEAKQEGLDAAADKARAGPQAEKPSKGNWFQNLFGSGVPDKTATPQAPAKDAEGRIGGPGMPVQAPTKLDMAGQGIWSKDAAINYVLKNYQPGTQFKDPDTGEVHAVQDAGTKFVVDGKTYTVPGQKAAAPVNPAAPKKMNYSPDSGNTQTPAQGAINRGLTGYHETTTDSQAIEQNGKSLMAKGGPVQTLPASPGRNPDIKNVDPRLVEVVSAGAQHLPDGYKVTINEGYNAKGHAALSQHHLAGKGALDIQIWHQTDNGWEKVANRGADTTHMYHTLAQGAYTEMMARHPELKGQLAHGAAFGVSRGSNVADLMHFDLGGRKRAAISPDTKVASGSN